MADVLHLSIAPERDYSEVLLAAHEQMSLLVEHAIAAPGGDSAAQDDADRLWQDSQRLSSEVADFLAANSAWIGQERVPTKPRATAVYAAMPEQGEPLSHTPSLPTRRFRNDSRCWFAAHDRAAKSVVSYSLKLTTTIAGCANSARTVARL